MNEQNTPNVSIALTRKQYLALMKAVYVGNWGANAQRDGGPLDPFMDEYEDILHFVFSHAYRFGLEKYVHREEEDGGVSHPTRLFEEATDVRGVLDAYDDAMFWDERGRRYA